MTGTNTKIQRLLRYNTYVKTMKHKKGGTPDPYYRIMHQEAEAIVDFDETLARRLNELDRQCLR